MKFFDIEQNSEEWMDLRRGKFTCSTFGNLFMAKNTAGYRNTIYQVIFERLTGETPESFSGNWMERGHEFEADAKETYELLTFNKVSNGGFVELTEWVGGSPDGFINPGLVEIKCPKYSTMIDYLVSRKLPKIYEKQVQGQLYVTGAEWCDFMCYHPKLKPLIIRIERDETMITEIKSKLEESIEKAKSIIKQLK